MKITLEQASLPENEIHLRGDITGPEITALLQYLRRTGTSGKIIAYREEEQFLLNPEEIVYLETGGTRVSIYTAKEVYESKLKLYELKEALSGHPFSQISKSTLVNIHFVKSIQAEFSGNYRIRLKNRPESLTISRKYYPEFRSKI